MLLVYENKDKGISAEWKKTVHMPPHLHEAIEVVYVTNGNIALGVGMELYNMDEGDFAIVFPNVIHHYQVFDEKENKAILGMSIFFMISFSGCGSALSTESTPEQLYSDDHSIDMFVPYMKYVEG